MATYSDVLPMAQKLARQAVGADRFSPSLSQEWADFEDYLLGKITKRDADEILKRAELEQVRADMDAAMVIIAILA